MRSSVHGLFLLLTMYAGLLAGCGAGVAGQVQSEAARDFHCPESRVEVRSRAQDTFVATGCDRQGVYQCYETQGTSRCVDLAWLARDRAAREFDCDALEVDLDEISPYVFRLRGCENEATYHCEITDARARCLRDERWAAEANR